MARRRLDDLGLHVPMYAASAERLPHSDASLDVVVADSLLEHLDNPAQALAEWARVLRPGGTLLVWSPNRFSLAIDPHVRLWGLGFLPRRWQAPYVKLRRGAMWPPRCLSPGEAQRLAQNAGFRSVELAPPAIPSCWARSRTATQQALIATYGLARSMPLARSLLRTIGPIWQLRATRQEVA